MMNKQQKEALEHLHKWKVGALFMEPGTGKTRIAVEIVKQCNPDYVLYIAPLRIIKPQANIPSIIDEVNKWGGFISDVDFIGAESIGASERIFLETIEKVQSKNKVFCIVDESLKIKNYEAKRTKRILEISKYCAYKIILNGTPLSRNILDMWSQMEFLSPKILNMTISQFKNTFCKYNVMQKKIGRKIIWQKEIITGYENIDYLHSLIKHYVYQCDLTLNIHQIYNDEYYKLSEEDYDAYCEIKDYYLDFETLLLKNDNIFFEMTQKMQHSYCVTEDKFRCVDKILRNEDESKCIIFCKYIKSREECEKRYPKAKVLSYQKESYGLNLQNYNITIYFDKVWDYALRMQSSRRTFRTGQEYDCKYYDLTGDVGLESLIDRNINKKISMSEYFKRITMEELRNEL